METPTDLRFGALVVKNGFASESDVDFALDTQRENSGEGIAPMLGEILVEMGALTTEKVNALVVEQNLLRSGVVDNPMPTPSGGPAPKGSGSPESPSKESLPRKALSAIGQKLRRWFRNWIGKTAKEKALASEKRDEALCRLAEKALEAGASGPDADSARKAREARDAARTKSQTAAPGRSALAASAGAKVAETKLKLALVKLARRQIEQNEVPDQEQPLLAEIRSLEAKIAEPG